MNDLNKIQMEYDFTYAELEREHQPWSNAKFNAERAAGRNSSLNKIWKTREKRMDNLLLELFDCIGAIALHKTLSGAAE